MKLYQINQELLDVIDKQTGEITDVDLFEQLEMDKKEKIHNTAKYLMHLDNQIDLIKKEEKRLADYRKSVEKKNDDLRNYLKRNMEIDGVKKYEFDTLKVSIHKNTPKTKYAEGFLENTDEYSILQKAEKDYKQAKADFSDMKADLKTRLKKGEKIDGARLEQDTHLDIK